MTLLPETQKILQSLQAFHNRELPKNSKDLNYNNRRAVQALIDLAKEDKAFADSEAFAEDLNKAVGDTLYLRCLFNGDSFDGDKPYYKIHSVIVRRYSEKSLLTLEDEDKIGVAITSFQLVNGKYHFNTSTNSEVDFTEEELQAMLTYLKEKPDLFFTGVVNTVEYETYKNINLEAIKEAFWDEPFTKVEVFAEKFALEVDEMQTILDEIAKVDLPFNY